MFMYMNLNELTYMNENYNEAAAAREGANADDVTKIEPQVGPPPCALHFCTPFAPSLSALRSQPSWMHQPQHTQSRSGWAGPN